MENAAGRSPLLRHITLFAPAVLVAGAAWGLYVFAGGTPVFRAVALALVIGIITFTLRPVGTIPAVFGGLILAICPAFWAQTGGEGVYPLALYAAALVGVALLGAVVYWVTRSPAWTIGLVGAALMSAALVGQVIVVGGARSLRLTTIAAALIVYLLADMLRVSNPRPDSGLTPEQPRPERPLYLLGAFTFGVVNDPTIALFSPAIILGLLLARVKLSPLVWIAFGVAILFGAGRLIDVYIDANYWAFSAERAVREGLQAPVLIGDAWREAWAWFGLFRFLGDQFPPVGVVLGVIGLARLSRWYPPLGIVTLTIFGMYALFGLLYFGGDSAVLLIPLLMIQVLWITYALAALRDWLVKMTGVRGEWRGVRNTL